MQGCERRAEKLGYSFDQFWLHDPKLKAESWIRVLRTRGIKGLILVGMMDQNHLPPHLRPVWENFPCVVTGVRTRNPALSFSCVDHHNLTVRAGMNQHTDAVGEATVSLVVSQIHHNETGIPALPRATLIGASWIDGASVRPQAARKRAAVAARI